MKKETIKKEKVIKGPKLVSYTIEATIGMGQYSNLKPSITVTASDIEEAHDYVMPFIEDLFNKHLNQLEKTVPITPSKVTPLPTIQIEVKPEVKSKVEVEPTQNTLTKDASVAFQNAEKAIASCYSLPALKSIDERIQKSEKLTEQEKLDLNLVLISKETEIKFNQK